MDSDIYTTGQESDKSADPYKDDVENLKVKGKHHQFQLSLLWFVVIGVGILIAIDLFTNYNAQQRVTELEREVADYRKEMFELLNE